jgi:hypothetical protein
MINNLLPKKNITYILGSGGSVQDIENLPTEVTLTWMWGFGGFSAKSIHPWEKPKPMDKEQP